MDKRLPHSMSKRTHIGGAWALFAFFSATIIITYAAGRIDRLLSETFTYELRAKSHLEMLDIRENFEQIIHEKMLALRELAVFIGENPFATQRDFSLRVQNIREIDGIVINVAAAPDLVVRLIHPLEPNAGALGLNYRTNEEQYPGIERMLSVGTELMAGPVDLVQGGQGMILRAPVYWPAPDAVTEGEIDESTRRLWGIVSLVLDYQEFLVEAGIRAAEERYDMLIQAADAKPTNDALLFTYGDESLRDADTVKLEFDLFFEEWVLEARTKGGWPKVAPDQWQKRALIAIAGLMLLGTLLYVLQVSERRKRAEALLSSGIEALNDGFVMFDAQDRLLLSNSKYKEMYDLPSELLRSGTPFEVLLRSGVNSKQFPVGRLDEAKWIERRLAVHRQSQTLETEQHLADGRVIKASDRPLADGSYVGLRVDVTELSHAKDAAEAASKAKTNFMGVLSHELRTPLTVIMGVAQLSRNARMLSASKALLKGYEAGDISPAEAKRLLDKMYDQLSDLMNRLVQSGDHLLHLINEILDVAKIESGSLVIEPTHCAVQDIVDPVIEQLNTLSSKKGLAFDVVQEADVVFADKFRARQILFNLIGNAIKFTDTGFVRLVVKPVGDVVKFEVHDSGAGIDEAELQSIFEVFYQVDSSATRRAGGTGMGLAISRSLAEMQGGDLSVSSVIGQGSCFTLTLPIKADENAGKQAA